MSIAARPTDEIRIVGSYMPASLAAELRELARRNDRTASSEVRHLVRQAVARDKTLKTTA